MGYRKIRGGGGPFAGLGALVGTALAVAGGWIAYSRLGIDHAVEMKEALPARRDVFMSQQGGQLGYYYDDRPADRRPVVFIHSINAAASAIELKPLFVHYQGQRPVYALDLPGFGFSDRSERMYSPQLYESAILDFLQMVVGRPADVVALSLGGEFAARAALARPDLVNSLVLISPTGFKRSAYPAAPAQREAEGERPFAYQALNFSLWRQPLYDLIATRASIRYFLQMSFTGAVPEELVDYAYATSHQPGAENAPLHFLAGLLFTEGIRPAVYERLEMPVLTIYDEDPYTTFEALPEILAGHSNWKAARIQPTRGMPHYEKTDEVIAALEQIWEGERT
jgi:pimeloyl-ACP methyl ester carboxylesterase